ncbi:unnamed protein product [Allacma fusca]|uniref:SCP domain-containing protein n=1 Tax=Allacma fusca TaxID=39272 RepID=A0A8J2PJV4_9HEXA|nr:unnamed protein product [Allacma fusca]
MIFITFIFSLFVTTTLSEINYQSYALNMHNNLRNKHGAGALTYNARLSEIATSCAGYYAQIGRIDHTCPYKSYLGENLAFFSSTSGPPYVLNSVNDAINGWYVECNDYNYAWPPRSSYGKQVYHFTQMVWKSTTYVGFGVYLHPQTGRTYVVALYEPKGNIIEYGPDAYEWFRGNVTAPGFYG